MFSQANTQNTSQEENFSITNPVTIANREGFNAQMAYMVSNESTIFTSKIHVFLLDRQGRPKATAQADSVRRLLSLKWIIGEQVVVAAYGHDARIAAETVSLLFKTCLGGIPTHQAGITVPVRDKLDFITFRR